jgi:hypothetical protein
MSHENKMGIEIARINTLLAVWSAPTEEINYELQEKLAAINAEHTLLARQEFVHGNVGVIYKYLPKHLPDKVACRADMNHGRLLIDSAVHSPFKKDGEPSAVLGLRILEGEDTRLYASYDLLPDGGELVVSTLFLRERAARLGGGLLELSARKK